VTIVAALASLLTKRRVRFRMAMTGEISLRGRVLRVGGIKEKVLAASRFGIKEIIYAGPKTNPTGWTCRRRSRPLKVHFVQHIATFSGWRWRRNEISPH